MRRYAVLTGEGPFRIRLLFQGILTGVAAGLAVVCYRFLLGFAGAFSFRALSGSAGISLPGLVLLWTAGALLIGLLMDWEPMAKAGGIPQVKGEILGQLSMDWLRVMTAKFLGGGLAIALGFSGTYRKSGPAVQIGAAAGRNYMATLRGKGKIEERHLLLSASAGLSGCLQCTPRRVAMSSRWRRLQEFLAADPPFRHDGLTGRGFCIRVLFRPLAGFSRYCPQCDAPESLRPSHGPRYCCAVRVVRSSAG